MGSPVKGRRSSIKAFEVPWHEPAIKGLQCVKQAKPEQQRATASPCHSMMPFYEMTAVCSTRQADVGLSFEGTNLHLAKVFV